MRGNRKAWRIAFEDAILAVLRDKGSLNTPEVREHFERKHYQDVYDCLVRMEKRGLVDRWRKDNVVVWTYLENPRDRLVLELLADLDLDDA